MKWTFTLTIIYGRYADKDETSAARVSMSDMANSSTNGRFWEAVDAETV